MYQSSNHSFQSVKYSPLFIGIVFLFVGIWIVLAPIFEIEVNGVKKIAEISDSYPNFILGSIFVVYYLLIGKRVVKMNINSDEFWFVHRGNSYVKPWSEVDTLKKYWLAVPPVYGVKFENDRRTYLFTTRYFCLAMPFYVFDLSEMGRFIKKRKKDIPLLKAIKKENHTTKE